MDNYLFLFSWWKWWESCRFYIFCVFKLGLNVLKLNLVEVYYFCWYYVGVENFILIQVCCEDVVESLKFKRRLEGYRKGVYKGG